MLCSSCGHDNPRENRYCGMCGTPFPHRFPPVPEEQSALTFPSAPLEIAPAQLPVTPEPMSPPVPLVTTTVEETLAQGESAESTQVSLASLPRVAAEPAAAVPPPQAAPMVEPSPVEEFAELATAPEIIPVETSEPQPSPAPAEIAPEQAHPSLAEHAEPRVDATPELPAPPPSAAPVPPPVSPEEVPSHPSLPEIRRYATPHREMPAAHVDTDTHTPPAMHRPAPQTLEPPPDSAGMPTFQAVAEASGAPPISPFEPKLEKNADEERELQEFVASFRYHPPEEAVDELTMRSEVPVIDAEAPVTPSHPSFDDDVPPPPEAGPHPTGEEYYPSAHAAADRSRYLEIGDTQHAASVHHTSASTSTSVLGIGDGSADSVPPPDQLAAPARRHWLLWTALGVLVAIFGTMGFFEGRAHRNHAYHGPIEIIQEQYVKLRQRISEMTASAPKPATDKQASEAPAKAEPQPKSPAAEQPAETTRKSQSESSATTNPAASPAVQTAATQDQPKPSTVIPAPMPAEDKKVGATPATPLVVTTPPQKATADTQPKPPTDANVAKREPVKEPPPALSKPKSRPDPGLEELAKAMQAGDPAAAAAWLWKATSRGNPVAPVRLADMYIKGKGVPHSCEQALVLLRSEADKENAPARNRLAALYINGTCVARDRVKAYQLMSSALAVDPSSEWADQNRKELWQQMTPAERALAEKHR